MPVKAAPPDYKRWTSGELVPYTAAISLLTDLPLANVLVHHKYVMELPQDWWVHPRTGEQTKCTIQCFARQKIKGKIYVNCHFLAPAEARDEGLVMQLPVDGYFKVQQWHVRRYLNITFHRPRTLQDIGITAEATEIVANAVMQAWANTKPDQIQRPPADGQQTGVRRRRRRGPFDNDEMNQVWAMECQNGMDPEENQLDLAYDLLADIDALEPDPATFQQAVKHSRLRPFWLDESVQEMQGLFQKGCFRKHRTAEMSEEDRNRVYKSRFHCHMKRHVNGPKRGKLKRCKVRLILQGNKLTKGEDGDFIDSFAPVSSATAVRTLISIAAADDLHLHSIDLEQAFIQGAWSALPEGAPTIFIQPPWGWEEEEGVVYELLKPLYGHPAAARALHYTLHGWLRSKGFEKSGFDESVWVRPAGGEYDHPIRLTAHVDDTLIAVRSLQTMQQFKQDLLALAVYPFRA